MGWRGLACVTAAVVCLVGCSSDFGRRPQGAAGGANYLLDWRAGRAGTYQWQWVSDFAYAGQHSRANVTGHVDAAVLAVDSSGKGLIQLTFTVETSTAQNSAPHSVVYEVQVDPRGKIVANPDGQFFELLDLMNLLPLLPPRGTRVGATWHEKYSPPNPAMENTRDFAVEGQYLRDERSGQSRVALLKVRLFATFDESSAYDRLFGPPPQGQPAHMTFHNQGTESEDITYSYDPAARSLVKSVATGTFNGTEDFIDASNGKVVDHESVVGTQTVTFMRSGS